MIAAICRHLDGIPLAIEFAAARAATLGVEHVASGLRDRFELADKRPAHRAAPASDAARDTRLELSTADRARSGNCCVASRSSPAHSRWMRPAPWRRGMTASEIADGIAELVGKSLVFRTAATATAEFRLLETTRVYAIDRLTESGALTEVARRHARYFLGSSPLEEERRSQRDEYLAAFRRRADEVHVALEWAFSATGDLEIGLALTIAAVPLWFELFQMTVARGRVEQALPCRTGFGSRNAACVAWATRFGTRTPRTTPSRRRSPARWRSPSASARRRGGRRHCGGCGRRAAAAAIIPPRSHRAPIRGRRRKRGRPRRHPSR